MDKTAKTYLFGSYNKLLSVYTGATANNQVMPVFSAANRTHPGFDRETAEIFK